jgi:hypothetical protein
MEKWFFAFVGTILQASGVAVPISIAICIFVASPANAQMGKDDTRALRGLKSIYLAIEGVDDEAQRCGITESLIRDAFLLPISQSKLQLSHDKTGPMFYIGVVVAIQAQPNQCVSFLQLAVINIQRVQLDYTDESPTLAMVRLWDDGWLTVGNPHSERVRNAIENATKKFLTTWNLANKP